MPEMKPGHRQGRAAAPVKYPVTNSVKNKENKLMADQVFDTQETTESNRKAEKLLRVGIAAHDLKQCPCDLSDGGLGYCYAGQWLEGVIDSEQVLFDLADDKD